ncbi:MAG: hypothetical protein P1P88_20570 [Bacteroidales bacterium]|nr:hypothetical protein [Bacteroidales bacterium]
MVVNFKSGLFIALIVALIAACGLDPNNLASSENDNFEKEKHEIVVGPITESSAGENPVLNNDLHTVVANEVLQATKYVYINVSEGAEKYWIATQKMEIKIGETYYYNGGLLKTNFESKEFNKVFDRIYLVSNLVGADHASHIDGNMDIPQNVETNKTKVENSEKKELQKGSITIAELVKNAKNHEGKTVQISGRCVKINPNIMNRNWIHIKDGSKDDFDLVITSTTFVPENTNVTFRGVVGLNRDFGAGYRYDIILENGVVVP